ncbi:MAG: tetratricopeptide repeat protein [Proteobacteria bacterium]|nr:tetratricopeptide repeat protein [Pseudomonadota bacterium]
MADAIKRDEVASITRKLNDAKKHLYKGNIHACLLSFKVVLEKTLSTKMLASDAKELGEEINDFQHQLSESRGFKDIFGPVTFTDSDNRVALNFVIQLLAVKEEEISAAIMDSQKDSSFAQDPGTSFEDIERQALTAKTFIDEGEYAHALEIINNNEDVTTFLLHLLNRAGIRHRKEEEYDEAINEFKKALVIQPDDEGLHYNIARSCIEKGEWNLAEESIKEALKINPDFKEGQNLLRYIQSSRK